MLKYNIQNYTQARYMEHSDAMGIFQRSLKRLFDMIFSLVGLVILSFLGVALKFYLQYIP